MNAPTAPISFGLSGRVVIITGGAQGIGEACARRFAREGARVVIARREETMDAQALAIKPVLEAMFPHTSELRQIAGVTVRELGLLMTGQQLHAA